MVLIQKQKTRAFSIATITLPGSPKDLIPLLSFRDRVEHLLVRIGWRRRRYIVEPALYRIGSPMPDSPVIVTANYKLTVDTVRAACAGMDLWVLVLDTRGINVWCAAGKGTFGTDEIERMVRTSRLTDIVKHRRLILPQLGAPGVSAHRVKKITGFTVIYGPVRIADLRDFLAADMNATSDMRHVRFTLSDRISVTPIELVLSWQLFLAAALAGLGLWAIHAAP
ncbi:MAG TPA: mercury methylation corrinoid protein HgcA, partial [bacterium]|nr:mercury methylation corrinoid protein HgcA [bacterium]